MTDASLMGRLTASQRLQAALLGLVCVIVFGNALAGGFVWDDNLFSANQVYWKFDLRTILFGLANGLEYQPVRDLTFLFDILVWRGSPWGFHLTNLLLFIVVTLLVQRLATALYSRFINDSRASLVPFATALLFASHPLRSEVVAWITQRNTLLATLFFLLATLLFLRWQDGQKGQLLALSCGCFILAFLSKATVVVLPLLLALLLLVRKDGESRTRAEWLALLPFGAIAAAGAALHLAIAGRTTVIAAAYFGSIQERLAVALQIPLFYLKQTLLPTAISAFYVDAFSRSFASPGSLAATLALVIILTACWGLRQRLPELALGFGWFIITLLPVANLFATSPVIADRYLFLPAVGLAFVTAVLMERLLQGNGKLLCVAALVAIPLGVMTVGQNRIWHDDISLWRATASRSPLVAGVWFNLGRSLHKTPQLSMALEAYLRAVKLDPADMRALDNAASLFPSTRGPIRERHELVRSLAEQLPDYPAGLPQIGNVQREWRYPDAAEELFFYLLAADPQSMHLRLAMANFYRKMGAADRAAAILRQ
ncbi:MAG: hypothetical protein FIA91_04960 [Geobacter sp.]|nr:hypothetical protein [Geobacter sp.]